MIIRNQTFDHFDAELTSALVEQRIIGSGAKMKSCGNIDKNYVDVKGNI
jgi:hypothetical protein